MIVLITRIVVIVIIIVVVIIVKLVASAARGSAEVNPQRRLPYKDWNQLLLFFSSVVVSEGIIIIISTISGKSFKLLATPQEVRPEGS